MDTDNQAPPVHYPSARESTAAVYRTREAGDGDALERNKTNGSGGSGSSSYQLPAYGEESAPPDYQEDPEELAKKHAKERRTMAVRVISSVFVAMIVSLIVAAAVTKIQHARALDADRAAEDQASESPVAVLDSDLSELDSAPLRFMLRWMG